MHKDDGINNNDDGKNIKNKANDDSEKLHWAAGS